MQVLKYEPQKISIYFTLPFQLRYPNQWQVSDSSGDIIARQRGKSHTDFLPWRELDSQRQLWWNSIKGIFRQQWTCVLALKDFLKANIFFWGFRMVDYKKVYRSKERSEPHTWIGTIYKDIETSEQRVN